MLWYRGYPNREYLFTGFPNNVRWNLFSFSVQELGECRYANCPPWSIIAGDSRLVKIGASMIDSALGTTLGLDDTWKLIANIGLRLRAGEALARLIAVEVDGTYVVVEGHKRATAFVRLQIERPIEVIVGLCDDFRTWGFR
jgi:hypothetical protein